MGWFGHPAQDREFNVSSEVVDMSSCQASARFNHNTVIYVCVCAWRTGTVSHVTSPSIIWSRIMLRTKSSRLNTRDGQKGRRKVLRKSRKGYEKKQVEKEGVSHEPGGFSTSFVFFLVCFIAHLSSLKLFFFSALIRHPKHHISVIFNITPQHVYIFRKLGVLASAQTSKMASFLDPDFTKAFVAG